MIIPCAEGPEAAVISVLMKEAYIEGEESLTEDHFHQVHLRKIFRDLQRSREFDLVSSTQRFKAEGELEALGGPAKLSEIYTFAPSKGMFANHLAILHEYRARRMAIMAARGMEESAMDLDNGEGFLTACATPVTEIFDAASANQRGKDKKDLVKEVLGELGDKIRGKVSPIGVTTGLRLLDETLYGLHQPRVWVISGYPTGGKTVLGVQISWNAALSGVPSLVISLEMPSDQLISRLLVPVTGLPALALRDPQTYMTRRGVSSMSKDELMSIKEGGDLIENTPIFFEDPSSASLTQVVATIRRYVRKESVKVVAIDYLQLIVGNPKLQRDERIAEISRTLQGLAKELGITLLILSQQNETGATKYSTAISDDADVIVSIAQDRDPDSEDFGRHEGLFVRKDRHSGKTGEMIPLYLDRNRLEFNEVEPPKKS